MSVIDWIMIIIGGLFVLGIILLILLSLVGFTSTSVQPSGAPLRLILPLVF